MNISITAEDQEILDTRNLVVGQILGDLVESEARIRGAIDNIEKFYTLGDLYNQQKAYIRTLEEEILRLRSKYEEPIDMAAILAAFDQIDEVEDARTRD